MLFEASGVARGGVQGEDSVWRAEHVASLCCAHAAILAGVQAYSVHTSRFLSVWSFSLPVSPLSPRPISRRKLASARVGGDLDHTSHLCAWADCVCLGCLCVLRRAAGARGRHGLQDDPLVCSRFILNTPSFLLVPCSKLLAPCFLRPHQAARGIPQCTAPHVPCV